jgi:hypothetical protein
MTDDRADSGLVKAASNRGDSAFGEQGIGQDATNALCRTRNTTIVPLVFGPLLTSQGGESGV